MKEHITRMFQAWIQGRGAYIKSETFIELLAAEYHCSHSEAEDLCKQYLSEHYYSILKKDYLQ